MRLISIILVLLSYSLMSYGQVKNVIYNKPVSEVWEIFLDHLSEKGIGISNADRGNGIILSTPQNYIKKWRYSDDNDPKNSKAFILLKKKSGLQPLMVTGRIMIRCKAENSGTRVSITLVDLEAMSDKSMDADWRYMEISSSGTLELEFLKLVQ